MLPNLTFGFAQPGTTKCHYWPQCTVQPDAKAKFYTTVALKKEF
jgi:hypothetical protein